MTDLRLPIPRLINRTASRLLFVHRQNLTHLSNNRWQVDCVELLEHRLALESEGGPLRVQVKHRFIESETGLPLVVDEVTGADPLPEGNDILIVSRIYAETCRKLCRPTDRLRVVSGGVYTPGQQFPIASLGLALVESCLLIEPYVTNALDFRYGVSDVSGALASIEFQRTQRN